MADWLLGYYAMLYQLLVLCLIRYEMSNENGIHKKLERSVHSLFKAQFWTFNEEI